jgi:hypothetical protein
MTELDERLKALEAKIESLTKKGDFYWEQTKQNFLGVDENMTKAAQLDKRATEIMWGSIQNLENWGKRIAEELELMRRKNMRYEEAYYHVFPDRREQDAKIADQLNNVISKPTQIGDSKTS